jgi:hypothetical protein
MNGIACFEPACPLVEGYTTRLFGVEPMLSAASCERTLRTRQRLLLFSDPPRAPPGGNGLVHLSSIVFARGEK